MNLFPYGSFSFFLAVFSVFALSGKSLAVDLSDGLQAYFDFEDSTFIDGGVIEGTPSGVLVIRTDDSSDSLGFDSRVMSAADEHRGSAINFSGKQGDALVLSPDIRAVYPAEGEAVTIGIWFNLSSSTGTQLLFQCGNRQESMTGYSVLYSQTGQISARVRGELGASLSTNPVTWSPGARVNRWHLVVLVIDRRTNLMKLYVDGTTRIAEVSLSGLGDIANANLPFTVGGVTNTGGTVFSLSGRVDDLGIWDRALDERDIAELYNQGRGRSPFSKPDPVVGVSGGDSADDVSSIIDPSVEGKKLEATQRTVTTGGMRIQVGSTVQISSALDTHCSYFTGFRLANGDIIVSLPWARTNRGITSFRSSDGGHTWKPAISRLSYDGGETWVDEPTPIYENFVTLPNGEVVGFDFPRNSDKLWVFNSEGTEGILYPVTVNPSNDESFTYQHTLTLNGDGNILATSQPSIMVDGEKKFYTPIHISRDGGRTWEYYSTAAKPGFSKYRHEGFTEPRLVTLQDGSILCLLRTANPDTFRRNGYRYGAVEVVRSLDDGRSWGAPMPIADYGVYPDAVVLDNGVVAVSFGRPGNKLIFSGDNGNTWSDVINIADTVRAPDCGHYNAVVQVGSNEFLLIFSTGEEHNQPTAIPLATRIIVERL